MWLSFSSHIIYIQFGGTLLYNQNCPKLQISLKSNFMSMLRNTIQLIRIKLEKQELQVILEPFISWVFYGNFNHCFVFYKRNCSLVERLFKVIPQRALSIPTHTSTTTGQQHGMSKKRTLWNSCCYPVRLLNHLKLVSPPYIG